MAPSLLNLPTYVSTSSTRLKYLYSDFSRQKSSNPSSYTSNVDWWRRTLEGVTAQGGLQLLLGPSLSKTGKKSEASNGCDRLVFRVTGPEIAETFRLEGVGKPIGLPTILAELIASKTFYPLTPFLTQAQSVSDPGSLTYRVVSFVVGKPLWWALGQLNLVGSDDFSALSEPEKWKRVKGDYVVLSLLERAADAVLIKQEQRSGSVAEDLYSFEGFRKAFSDCGPDGNALGETDVKVLVKYLEREKAAVAVKNGVIKFMQGLSTHEITNVDVGILELKTSIENLESSVIHIQRQIDERIEKIKLALSQKRKETALTHLRARKQYEDLLKKRLSSLETLQSTLIRLEASVGDVEIMRSYETSTQALRDILSHPSLQREHVEQTMDALAAANADAQEIDETIRIGSDQAVDASGQGVSEDELADELAALVREVEDEREIELKKHRVPVREPTGSKDAIKGEERQREKVAA